MLSSFEQGLAPTHGFDIRSHRRYRYFTIYIFYIHVYGSHSILYINVACKQHAGNNEQLVGERANTACSIVGAGECTIHGT